MPAAGDVGAADELLDWVVGVRPDVVPALQRALAIDNLTTQQRMQTLLATDRPAYDALVLVVLAGYYRHPDVRERIGYPGQVPMPVPAHDFPEYISEGLLDYLVESS
jgi:hypothetical protein